MIVIFLAVSEERALQISYGVSKQSINLEQTTYLYKAGMKIVIAKLYSFIYIK